MSILNQRFYTFTVKVLYNPTHATRHAYTRFFDHARRICCIYNKFPEITNDILHYHGIFILQKNFFRYRLRLKGYHLFLKPVNDKDGWITYMKKNACLYSRKLLKSKCII